MKHKSAFSIAVLTWLLGYAIGTWEHRQPIVVTPTFEVIRDCEFVSRGTNNARKVWFGPKDTVLVVRQPEP